MIRIPFIILASLLSGFGLSQGTFKIPIEGIPGIDYRIINYVDWGSDSSIVDQHCLTKTYDGHQGTDFVLSSFRAMDEGVNVLAVDSGVIIFTHDGEFDREKESVISKGLGNYIGITHDGEFQTYYGHLKKNSLLVSEGDTVSQGQVIAQVASSGNSTDPHLHFELWYDSTFYIDPFSGPCGNGFYYWQEDPEYDSTFAIWHSSLWNGFPTLDTLGERPKQVDTFTIDDSLITYWSLIHGLRAGDSISVEWRTPTDSLWFQFDLISGYDQWYYYFWTYIEAPTNGPLGTWNARFYRNQEWIDTKPFYMEGADPGPGLSASHLDAFPTKISYRSDGVYLASDKIKNVWIYDALGRQMATPTFSQEEVFISNKLTSGLFHVVIQNQKNERIHKQILLD